jgi:hypothetical protein
MTTPTTPEGLRQFDHLPWHEAVRLAWTQPGSHPGWHALRRRLLGEDWPVLARALNRAQAETGRRPVPWEEPAEADPPATPPGAARPILALDEDPAGEGER